MATNFRKWNVLFDEHKNIKFLGINQIKDVKMICTTMEHGEEKRKNKNSEKMDGLGIGYLNMTNMSISPNFIYNVKAI